MLRSPNILFIMADQLRWDYLGCAGHPHIKTPNIDALARRGTRFTRAFVQAPVCGGSRMSFYSGRYALSHGAAYNGFPLRVDEKTIGDYLRPQGYRVLLLGKTHFAADYGALQALGIDPSSAAWFPYLEGGFEVVERDDGLHPEVDGRPTHPDPQYNRWLREKGYPGENPWHAYANSAEGDNGELLSGWAMRNAGRPARVREEHSETAYTTDRALALLGAMGDDPWCLHLSFIKPHWPYMAPAPYHAMYGARHVLPPNRTDAERHGAHPVLDAFRAHEESVEFSRDVVRNTVIPTYMGLVSQLDHHLGRLFAHLESTGALANTIVVLTSDHGDYLGDHWLGEKDLFHEEIVRTPLIIADPRASADGVRGRALPQLVESIDLAPTFLEWSGGAPEPHRLEGLSLAPLLRGEQMPSWREAVFCDSDYSLRPARLTLGIPVSQARGFMVRDARWKYVRFPGFPPLLFDLIADPCEQVDLGRSPAHVEARGAMERRLLDWALGRRNRLSISDEALAQSTGKAKERGFPFGVW